MATEEQAAKPKTASIIDYVENFIDKRDSERRRTAGSEVESQPPPSVNRESIVIDTTPSNTRRQNTNQKASDETDIDADELNLESDPVIETRESDEQVYRQQVYLRQYQPPTPEPIDIQVQEIIVKPKPQRPPIHVHVQPSQNRDAQRTPSPILIRSAPPQAAPSESTEPIVYHKYVPVDYKGDPQQIIIHRYAEMPPKPRPIVVEQWLPNKPAPKRITYRHVDRQEIEEVERPRNRFIEYTKPHTTIEVEVVRLPVTKLSPEEYSQQSGELARLDKVRSITRDPNILQWRI